MAKPLFTIGYEHSTTRAMFDELKDAKVDLVVDVRAVSSSRRPGFSKRQLAAGLDERGIRYLHLRALGTPKEGRLAARAGRRLRAASRLRRLLVTRFHRCAGCRWADQPEASSPEPGGANCRGACAACHPAASCPKARRP